MKIALILIIGIILIMDCKKIKCGKFCKVCDPNLICLECVGNKIYDNTDNTCKKACKKEEYYD